jgi:hypothetical protein
VSIHGANGLQSVYPQDEADHTQPHGADLIQKGWPTDGKLNRCAGGKGLIGMEGDAAAADVHRTPGAGLESLTFAFAQYLVAQFAPNLEARIGSAVVSVHFERRQGRLLQSYRSIAPLAGSRTSLSYGIFDLEDAAEIVNKTAPTDTED